ncbi:resolvase [Nitrobacter sp. Nb-311A]|uniref:recombinase family protein n=1 Tax=Nitrobacter sp. Nb-311A TaxID=314253 RepID=UPI00006849B2|nr:recombinase family protein [Nitrobacter sp. Nb-311A]EAQ35309.1 resolvase [Nitrobacter sp. Nb-311A]
MTSAGKSVSGKSVRCAIYTRVSTDAGLDQEFNSLDAQYDASEAYIRSQTHASWTLIKTRYDDGGFSGGSTDRPALQKLLDDVRTRKINVIVVYKVDRLTRSLADFAKLVELFDAHNVSFVSVTQQFNTTTSMGRLTLNVLLSFAQFEREVTAERIRDKIAASKRKGLWVGGMVPLGYSLNEGKLSIHADEAKTVRLIFERYLELGSVNRLVADLKSKGLTSKVRRLSTGAVRGGVPFTQGPLFYMLRNRFYIGEVTFKGEVLPGPQPPLLERSLFDAVQAKLAEQWSHRTRARQKSKALLSGLLFDDAGNRMIATHATKNRVRYRYYISRPLQRGHTDEPVGSISRVPADQIEALVTNTVRDRLTKSGEQRSASPEQHTVAAHVAKVEVRTKHLAVTMKRIETTPDHDRELAQHDNARTMSDQGEVILIPWTKPPMRKFRDVIQSASASIRRTRPIRAERRIGLIRAIARGRQWLEEIVWGRSTIEQIAVRHKCSARQINLTLSMAFLAPPLVKAAIEGRLPRGIGIAELRDAPPEWSKQYLNIGLPPL